MTELFDNISARVKHTAEIIWNMALLQDNYIFAAEFLNNMVNFYKKIYTEEEIEFLQFYIQMRMEMMKE